MRTLGGLSIALLMAGGLFGQFRGNPGFSSATPRMTGNFGNVVFPGGTPATYPGVTRSFGSVTFPGGGGPKMVVPGAPASVTDPSFGLRLGNTVGGRNPYYGYGRPGGGDRGHGQRGSTVYAYPVYVGGFYDPSYSYPIPAAVPQEEAPPPQNVTVVYPPQPAAPVMIYPGTAGGNTGQASEAESNFRMYQAPSNQPAQPAQEEQPTGYLLAFKDHTIYSAVAYWVDGDTLHYFTSGNKHNQASLSLVDREMTERLNRETGMSLNLPPAKQ